MKNIIFTRFLNANKFESPKFEKTATYFRILFDVLKKSRAVCGVSRKLIIYKII